MVMAVLFRITGNPAWAAGFAVSFASSNADTWSSEIGVSVALRSCFPGGLRRVPRGVSGGVSLLGCVMALAGAAFIAVIFAAENLSLRVFGGGGARIPGVVRVLWLIGGFVGSIVDSLLGTTVQAQYLERGEVPRSEVTDADGTPNKLARGLPFVDERRGEPCKLRRGHGCRGPAGADPAVGVRGPRGRRAPRAGRARVIAGSCSSSER